MDRFETGIYIIIAIAIVLGVIVLNWTLTFYQLWSKLNVRPISTRRPKSVILFGISCTVALLIRNPTTFWFALDSKLFDKTFWFQNILLHCTSVGMNYILIYRTWMVYYDIKWNQALEDVKWESQIDTETLKPSWYIQKRQIWGNPKIVTICLLIPWSFCCLCGTVVAIFIGNKPAILFAVLSLLFGIPTLSILSCKMPKYNDFYKLRKETQILSIMYCVFIATMFSLTFIIGSPLGSIRYILLQIFHITILFSLAVFSFYWVFKTFKLPKSICAVSQYQVVNKMSNIASDSVSQFNDLTFVQVFNDDDIFHDFARHLSQQFAIENILFFLETHQFIECMQGIINTNETQQLYDIKCSANIPQSTIVAELKENINNDVNAVYIAATNLFLKYIDNDAYFLINISYETREALRQTFNFNSSSNSNDKFENIKDFMANNDIANTQICHVFDQSRAEICTLLLYFFMRFRHAKLKVNIQ